jgi:hypothetical protein
MGKYTRVIQRIFNKSGSVRLIRDRPYIRFRTRNGTAASFIEYSLNGLKIKYKKQVSFDKRYTYSVLNIRDNKVLYLILKDGDCQGLDKLGNWLIVKGLLKEGKNG